MQQNHDEMAEKYISAVETYTMQDLADYINAADEWPADVEDIIERNGWVSDCGTKFGVFHSTGGGRHHQNHIDQGNRFAL